MKLLREYIRRLLLTEAAKTVGDFEARTIDRQLAENFNLGAAKHIVYTAFFLNDVSRSKLLQFAPKGWRKNADHMTIVSPRLQSRRLPSRWLDFSGGIEVVGIAKNNRVVSPLVDLKKLPIPMKGPAFPHITIATNGADPEESNNFSLSDFEPIDSPITVFGAVEEKLKRMIGPESEIYCDMDGVLVDFEASTIDLVHTLISGEHVPGIYPDKRYTYLLEKIKEELGPTFEVSSGADLNLKPVRTFMFYVIKMDPGGFYASLPPLEDGVNQLWPFINGTGNTIKLLTAGVKGHGGASTSKEGKTMWAMENLNPSPSEVIETRAIQKSEYAEAGGIPHVLIDDKASTIQSWNDKGGIGILHTPGGSSKTIARLQEFGL